MPPKARDSHIVPSLKNESLISIGNYYDEEYVVIFSKRHLHIVAMDKYPQTQSSSCQQIKMRSKAVSTLQMECFPWNLTTTNP